MIELGQRNAWLLSYKALGRSRRGRDERLHGVKSFIGESAAQALGFIVRHVEVLLVEGLLELVMIGLDLSL